MRFCWWVMGSCKSICIYWINAKAWSLGFWVGEMGEWISLSLVGVLLTGTASPLIKQLTSLNFESRFNCYVSWPIYYSFVSNNSIGDCWSSGCILSLCYFMSKGFTADLSVLGRELLMFGSKLLGVTKRSLVSESGIIIIRFSCFLGGAGKA